MKNKEDISKPIYCEVKPTVCNCINTKCPNSKGNEKTKDKKRK